MHEWEGETAKWADNTPLIRKMLADIWCQREKQETKLDYEFDGSDVAVTGLRFCCLFFSICFLLQSIITAARVSVVLEGKLTSMAVF